VKLEGTTVIYHYFRFLSDDVFQVPSPDLPYSRISDFCMLQQCSHEFSWPRRAPDGRYYQFCFRCAAEYQYDWQSMQRIEQVIKRVASEQNRRTNHQKPSWVPRAQRLTLRIPIRYRVKGLGTWHEGMVENLSQSGILFVGPQHLPQNTLVEMVFEMPKEISGQDQSTVLCQGRIIRRKNAKNPDTIALAAIVLNYRFTRKK